MYSFVDGPFFTVRFVTGIAGMERSGDTWRFFLSIVSAIALVIVGVTGSGMSINLDSLLRTEQTSHSDEPSTVVDGAFAQSDDAGASSRLLFGFAAHMTSS